MVQPIPASPPPPSTTAVESPDIIASFLRTAPWQLVVRTLNTDIDVRVKPHRSTPRTRTTDTAARTGAHKQLLHPYKRQEPDTNTPVEQLPGLPQNRRSPSPNHPDPHQHTQHAQRPEPTSANSGFPADGSNRFGNEPG
ncbi:hypothetical protein GCM10010357_16810 [Streptomyces luteireticuli]|uniref:Uncharacterized protein n=1 Tax=Streptomyces luteireticuli TaxID=173858 RepID=A0ABP3IBC4_9ACTN